MLKNDGVNGKDDNPYMKWTIKAMFETTNQIVNSDVRYDGRIDNYPQDHNIS